jgi:lipoprotein-releasing system permease protein
MSAELYIARRYMLNRRQGAWGLLISLMAIGSVALGVAALIITLAVMTGFREDIQSKILGIQPHVKISALEGEMNMNDPAFERVLNNNPKIAAWAPYVMGQILIGRGAQSTGAVIKGIIPEQEITVTHLENKLKHG